MDSSDRPAETPLQSKFKSITKFESFEDVCEVDTEKFLLASKELADAVVEDLGSAFLVPKKDMLGNIKKVQERYNSCPDKFKTLNKMLEEESTAEKQPTKAIEAIIWLFRGLKFLRAVFTNLAKDFRNGVEDESFRPAAVEGYKVTLKQHHPSVLQFVVENTFRLLPYRSTFYKLLATDPSVTTEMVIGDMEEYLVRMSAMLDLVQSLLEKHKLDLDLKA